MQDLHSELLAKWNTANRSLEPVDHRILPEPKPHPDPQWKEIFEEFQAKRLAKNE